MAFLFALAGQAPGWALTRAGTTIVNRATAIYQDGDSGVSALLQSNSVDAQVQPLEGAQLTPNQTVQQPAGAPVSLAHRLTNNGNVATSYQISLANQPGDDYDLSNLKIFADLNDNGVADAGEPEIGASPLALDVDESRSLVITGLVPASAQPDQTARLQLAARGTLQGAGASNLDTVAVSSGLALQVLKAASLPSAKGGELVTFTLTALNRGSLAPPALPVTVDGAPRQLVLLRDAIPANAALQELSNQSAALPLYHRLGDAPNAYLSRAPQNLETVDAIAYGAARLAAGSSLQGAFTVRLHPNISGDVSNIAHLFFGPDASGGAGRQVDSNQVRVAVPAQSATIRYHTNRNFEHVATSTTIAQPLHIQVEAAEYNLDPTAVEKVRVTIMSQQTGDVMRVDALESAPNSGLFRVVTTPIVESTTKVDANGVVETVSGDTLTASFLSRGAPVSTTILVDPAGVVYDSRSNAPIAGARVTLIDVTGAGNGGRAGQDAQVFFPDESVAPSSVVTGADGRFQFPRVAASTYRLQVQAPANYRFPSQVAATMQPRNRVLDGDGSFGGSFSVSDETGAVRIDVPLDAQAEASSSGLLVQKTASRRQVEIGEFVDYQITLKNTTDVALGSVVLSDVLPVGFKFQGGTARLGSATLVPLPGGALSFDLGSLAAGAQTQLTYRVLVGPGSKIGRNVNRATARAASGARSNQASATVEVQGGPFDEKAIVLGRVWLDANRDGQVQAGEVGLPGVRVWVEDGTFAVTDENGNYSLYGLEARTHVLKLDATTLPAGVQMEILSARYGQGGRSYLIDLKKGELHKANFASSVVTPELLNEARARRALVAASESEAAQSLQTALTPDGAVPVLGDARALPASGFVGRGAGVLNPGENGGSGLAPDPHARPLNSQNSNLPSAPVRKVPSVSWESVLPTLTPELGFLDLKEGDTLPLAQANVRVKGAAGSTFRLSVNGVEVPQSRVGFKGSAAATAWEYIGVKLKPGSNALRLEQFDSFGIARGQTALNVIAPGDLGRLQLTLPASNAFADGRSLLKVLVSLSDASGTPVSTRTPVTLEAESGQWQVADLSATEPGVQVFIEGGRAEFLLRAPAQPGNCAVRASSGVLQSSALVSFVPELRPLLATGVATAKVNLFGFKARGASRVDTSQIFENEDKARGALFVKGRVLGQYLLTLRYDSQGRDDNDRLFRDIQPDAYYPVYGDATARGFDAQSSGKLYVRVDDKKSYLLVGDYTTSSLDPARSLGDYSRSLNGVKAHRETDRLSANAFVSRDNQRQIVDEIRGNGTSGRYGLRAGDIVEQSEKVEIIVRDRNQPSVVLSSTPQTRFTDYTLDSFSGGLVFRAPIPSADANLNPVFIRVFYEVDGDGPKFTVAGADAQFRVSDKLALGGAVSSDRNPQGAFDLRSVNATYHLAPGTTLVGEWAQSERGGADSASGNAQRVELLHEDPKLSARAFWGRSDSGFQNPASLLAQGHQEATLKATYRVNGSNRVVADAIKSDDLGGSGTRKGAQLAVQHSFANDVQLEVGARKVKDGGTLNISGVANAPADFTSLRAKVSAPLPNRPQAHVFAEYERAVQGDGQALAVGGDYQVANRGRIYARHELISSLNGRYGLNDTQEQHATVFGMDAAYAKNGRVFSEYRVDGGLSGREAQASIGLRNSWALGEGTRFNTTFERIKDLGGGLAGAAGNDSIAATGALEYTRSPNFKGTARLEARGGGGNHSVLSTLGAAYKISPDLTLLGKGVYSRTDAAFSGTSSGDGVATVTGVDLSGQNQRRAVLGLAYRSTQNDRLQALLKYEYRGVGGALAARLRRQTQIVSANANYQASRRFALSGRYALRSTADELNGIRSRSLLQLFAGRATYNLGRRADVSLLASVLRGGGSTQSGLGAEVGFRLSSNLRLGAGYLLGHFRDDDLPDDAGSDAGSDSGFYLRFGYEFDESSLGGLLP